MWPSLTLLCLQAVLLIQTTDSSVLDGLVSTPWGKIQGVPRTSPSGPNHTSFEGIPYAKPPLGNLRFSKPVPSSGRQGTVLIADAVKPSCLMDNSSRESEDCLYLDLYVPHTKSKDSHPFPVMVFIHGGGFIAYGGPITAERLLAKNVIVALVHYRLGAMGFLSTGDDVLKGNYGLWDQRMAIQWVKDNVAAFGGNPNSITVFGESAGSASVGYKILAPEANNIFQKAILESGSANSGWALSRDPAKLANDLGRRLGCTPGSSSADLAQCLRNAGGIRLQKEMFKMYYAKSTATGMVDFLFVPVVDHEFVPDEPFNLIKNQTYLQEVGAFDKQIIIGMLNNESSAALKTSSLPNPPKFGDYFANEVVPFFLRQRYGDSTSKAEEAVEKFYPGNVSRKVLNKHMVSNIFVDLLFFVPTVEFLEALSQSKTGSGRQYFYYFDYCPSLFPQKCMGHGTDLAFIFDFPNVHFNSTPDDWHISDMFTSLLTTFARTGTPKASNTPTWPPFSTETKSYLQISKQPQVKQNLFPDRRKFWSTTVPPMLSKSSGIHTWTNFRFYFAIFLVLNKLA